eukprot:TRINITY_DN698_c5_g1_i1.p1 TRINITY_DN698_c5_g1~~TRINITY_DN698_c5_g1_i1.p1  ORF type:complete len:345 (-),score=70.03 TRINITY_DN698_c5_g1_i1:281-1315(-)
MDSVVNYLEEVVTLDNINTVLFNSNLYFVNYICLGLFVSGLFSFISLLFINAPYGRYAQKRSKGWGPLIPVKYVWLGWVIMEAPSSLFMIGNWIIATFINPQEQTTYLANRIMIVLFLIHYINRAFVYPLRIKPRSPMIFSIPIMAFLFCALNGYIQGKSVCFHLGPQLWERTFLLEKGANIIEFDMAHLYSYLDLLRFCIGVFLFLFGFIANMHSDEILRNLRKQSTSKDGKTDYKIPYGGMFRFVSAGNYAGEIIEWFGWFVACGFGNQVDFGLLFSSITSFDLSLLYNILIGSLVLAPFTFSCFTFFNIGPRGAAHHKWYLEKFREEYPKLNRKAVIPFIW